MARSQSLERPIHVEAPSWWRTALRHNLWFVFATGAFLLVVLALAATPCTSRTAFVVVMSLATACVAGTALWQRGRPDRYPASLLASMLVGLAGGLVSGFAAGRAAWNAFEVGESDPFALGVLLLAVAAILALVALVELLWLRPRGRGRWIAAYVFVWAGFWASFVEVTLTDRWVVVPSDVRVPRVDASYDHLINQPVWGPASLLAVSLEGGVYTNPRSVSAEPSVSFEDASALSDRVAEFVSLEKGELGEGLFVAFDRDERFARAVTLLEACRVAGQRSVVLVATAGDAPETSQGWHPGGTRVGTGLEREPGETASPYTFGPLDLVVLQRDDGSLAFALEGGEPSDFDALIATLERLTPPKAYPLLRLTADADLRWETALRFIARLDDGEHGFVDGFAFAE